MLVLCIGNDRSFAFSYNVLVLNKTGNYVDKYVYKTDECSRYINKFDVSCMLTNMLG